MVIVEAQDVCDALNEEGFGAHVEHDHSQFTGAMSAFVVSNFSIDTSNTALSAKIASYLETIPKEHVQRFDTHVAVSQLTIIHNPLFVTAHQLSEDISEKTGILTKVKLDGNEGKVWEFPEHEEEESKAQATKSCCMAPTVILSGVFWIISMFSYVGGNW
ncbi:MAG: hypothetical protein SGILL_005125 [Bacillariaceae sp.]